MAKQKENFLDYTPRRNANLPWRKKGTLVEVDVEHKGFINKIAQKFFHRPRISHIALDEFGSFIWPLLDGTQSVEQIGRLVKDHFGKKAEPLYERLCSYLKTLHREGFIVYENKISSPTKNK